MQLDKLVTLLGLDCCDQIPFLQQQAAKLKVSRASYLAVLGVTLGIAFILLGVARVFLMKLITVVYPVIETIRTLEQRNYEKSKQWLSYWIVVSIFHFLDDYLYWFLYNIPYYHFFKFFFIIALFHPAIQGAEAFYDQVIHKVYIKYQDYLQTARFSHSKIRD